MPPEEPDIKTGTADSILAGLWRQIKKELEVDDTKVESLIDRYATLAHKNPIERTQFRGNLKGELSKDAMTWKNFVRGMKVLRAKTVEITFVLHHVTLISQHTLTMDLEESEDVVDTSKRNVLSDFFRNLLNDLGIDLGKFDSLLGSYMYRSKIPLTTKNRTHQRGNLKKEFLGPKLTWRSLVKGFNFLCVVKFEMRVKLTLQGIAPSEHRRMVVLNDIEDFEDSNEERIIL